MEQRQLSRMRTHRIKARENCYCEPAFLSEKRVNCVFFLIFDQVSTFLYNAAVSNNQNCLHVLPRDILLRAIPINLMSNWHEVYNLPVIAWLSLVSVF